DHIRLHCLLWKEFTRGHLLKCCGMEHIVRTAYRRRYAFCIPYVTKEETESFVAKSASHLILLGFISTEDVYLADALFQKVCRHSGPEGARSSCDSNHGIVERIHLIF